MTQPTPQPLSLKFTRVCITTSVVTAIAALWAWGAYGLAAVAGLVSGAGLGLVMLSALTYVVEHTIRGPEDQPENKTPYWILHVGKFFLAGAVIFVLLKWLPAAALWFAVGYGIPIAVIFLKPLGQALNHRLGIR